LGQLTEGFVHFRNQPLHYCRAVNEAWFRVIEKLNAFRNNDGIPEWERCHFIAFNDPAAAIQKRNIPDKHNTVPLFPVH
jgi:hypothetical protein